MKATTARVTAVAYLLLSRYSYAPFPVDTGENVTVVAGFRAGSI